jgi:hypothetical protein
LASFNPVDGLVLQPTAYSLQPNVGGEGVDGTGLQPTANSLSADVGSEQLGQLFYNELVFIQSGIYDSEALIADLEANALATGRNVSIVVLNGTENGFDQISRVLTQYNDLDAIHFVSHGTDGMIQLGGSWLTAGNIEQYQSQLQAWGMSLSDSGDILIYGCDVAAGPEGQAFIDTVARLTGADVAASTDKTGDLSRGGDWSFGVCPGGSTPHPRPTLPLSGARGDELYLLPSDLWERGWG